MVVFGRKWLDRKYGNTYHAVCVVVGEGTYFSEVTYGYENQFLQTAKELIAKKGIEAGEITQSFCCWVKSKKDLKFKEGE